MTKIGLAGAAGQMGLTLARLFHEASDFSVVAGVEAPDADAVGADLGELAGLGRTGVTIMGELTDAVARADIVVDFSVGTVTPLVADTCGALKKGLVIGTTGVDAAGLRQIETAAEQVPIVMASNMGIGVNAMLKLVDVATRAIGAAADIEITEMHHGLKVDAPSGTALSLGHVIATARDVELDDVATYGRHGHTGQREQGKIAFHSLRGGDVVGEHTVTFALAGERIEITHRAQSREVFARGAVQAARFVSSKIAAAETGLYGMDDVLGLS